MSRADHLAHLEAQRDVVQAQRERLRPEQRLMRINLESRLRTLDDELAALGLEDAIDRRVKVVLSFAARACGSRRQVGRQGLADREDRWAAGEGRTAEGG